MSDLPRHGFLDRLMAFGLENRPVVFALILLMVIGGLVTAPFDWDLPGLPRDAVPVDAIPDIGENQQIVFTAWPGRSPQDVEDQISYPLTMSLMGMKGVRTVRSFSMLGFSSVYVIFADGEDFYDSRSRILEKLSSLPPGTLPEGVSPRLGPEATGLGQIFWYTLEGVDDNGLPTGGWDLDELRSVQDWQVRYALLSAGGVAEVASVGGHVREYQIDLNPDALHAWNVGLEEVARAVRGANRDVGARSLEINSVEYLIRGVGQLGSLEDLENTVVRADEGRPLLLKHLADIGMGPALRRGALDREGAEAVGGVVVVRYGENPLTTIENVKRKIAEIEPGLPGKILADGTRSQLRIRPFYDRTGLISETLGTLETALRLEILITILVMLLMITRLRASLLVALLLPLAVLMSFIAMKLFGVDANIVALSGIAIAIGTMVDMGIVMVESILRRLGERRESENTLVAIYQGGREVGGAVLTATATTVISFLPVFGLQAAEGKLFRPLAATKSFALVAAALVALLFLPALARGLLTAGRQRRGRKGLMALISLLLAWLLAAEWLPLGPERGGALNFLFVAGLMAAALALFGGLLKVYPRLLAAALERRYLVLAPAALVLLLGAVAWRSLETEFMPPLDEGSFLLMPTTMPHASLGEALDVLQKQDASMAMLPELDSVTGKIGRAETALDPAPVSMIETVINYKSEYLLDGKGRRQRFRHDAGQTDWCRDQAGAKLFAPDGKPYRVKGRFERDGEGRLIPDRRGAPFRQWRRGLDPDLNPDRSGWAGIRTPDDIWQEILRAAEMPGTTSAPLLQPIQTRIVMLQSGMRAPLGLRVQGASLSGVEDLALQLEALMRSAPGISAPTVSAERVVGKPYLEITPDREKLARHGLSVAAVQEVIEIALGGKPLTVFRDGRERYPVRLRYARERRGSLADLARLQVRAPGGALLPLGQLATITYRRGPQVIKSEDGFLTAYVLFGKEEGISEGEAVKRSRAFLEQASRDGRLDPPAGASYSFAGTWENQERASARLRLLVPLALLLIFALLSMQFRSAVTALLVFSGVAVAWSGGFILLWCYGRGWFPDLGLLGLRDLFHVGPVNLSVAVWVGFLALFGIATDDGVLMATILGQRLRGAGAKTREDLRALIIEGASRRVRPALMTSATTLLALLPILSSSGRGADVMIPMALPVFGGMIAALLSVFLVPLLYCWIAERRL